MANLISAFTVTILLWISICLHFVQPATIRGHLSDLSLVSDIVNYVKPYIQSLQLGPQTVYERPRSFTDLPFKSGSVLTPERAIDDKINELRPYLQDNDVGGKLELKEVDEPTIVEFRPKAHQIIINGTIQDDNETESFQTKLGKYKKMRNKIKLALEGESVSEKTRQIVTKTLDKIIATLVQRQCQQNLFQQSDLNKLARFRTNFLEEFISNFTNNVSNCYIFGKKLSDADCKTLKVPYNHCEINGKKISQEECKTLVKNLTNTYEESFKDYFKTLLDPNIINFYNYFNKVISNILRNSHKVPERYKVKCTLVDLDKEEMKKKILRNKDVCLDFRVCSEELREFLIVFYKSLNDTAVRVFRNYAAMYEKDIITDESEEKNIVIANINHVGDLVEERVSNVFVKTTAQIALDENKDRKMNIAVLREFVKHTIKTVNYTVAKHLEAELTSLKARLLVAVTADLAHSLSSDLGHFETDVIKQICSFFATCKGKLAKFTPKSEYSFRKEFNYPRQKPKDVFMQVELSLDDELKDNLMRSHQALMRSFRSDNVVAMKSQYSTNSTITVTRTTTRSNKGQPTTFVKKSALMEKSDTSESVDDNSLKISRK